MKRTSLLLSLIALFCISSGYTAHASVSVGTIERDTLLADKAALVAEKDALAAERDTLLADKTALVVERDELRQRVAELEQQTNAARTENGELEEKLARMGRSLAAARRAAANALRSGRPVFHQ